MKCQRFHSVMCASYPCKERHGAHAIGSASEREMVWALHHPRCGTRYTPSPFAPRVEEEAPSHEHSRLCIPEEQGVGILDEQGVCTALLGDHGGDQFWISNV